MISIASNLEMPFNSVPTGFNLGLKNKGHAHEICSRTARRRWFLPSCTPTRQDSEARWWPAPPIVALIPRPRSSIRNSIAQSPFGSLNVAGNALLSENPSPPSFRVAQNGMPPTSPLTTVNPFGSYDNSAATPVSQSISLLWQFSLEGRLSQPNLLQWTATMTSRCWCMRRQRIRYVESRLQRKTISCLDTPFSRLVGPIVITPTTLKVGFVSALLETSLEL